VNRGLAWIAMASSLVWLLDIVSIVIILAFWITPEEFGVAALAISLFPVLDLATEMGLSAAVVQRDDHTPERVSTVFWLNLCMSLFMAAALTFVFGPLLGALHGHRVVGYMLGAYGLKLLWANVFLIPAAFMRRELRFKELSMIRAAANTAEFVGKVGFAAAGFGVWCFVAGPFCRVLVTGIGVQMRHPWRPRFVFRLRETWTWVKFGMKASASQILFHVYTNLDYQVVGYYFGAEANGFYRLGYEIVLEPCRLIANTLVAIAFPAYSRLKRDRERLIGQFISFTRLSLVIMLAVIGLVLVDVEDLVATFWGTEWLPSATVARVLCAVGLLRALSYVVPPLLDGIGRPGLTLTYSTVAAVVVPALFVAAAELLGDRLGYLSVAIAWVIGYPIAFTVLFALALRALELPVVSYVRRVGGIPACALAAAGLAWIATRLAVALPPGIRLAIAAVVLLLSFTVLLARFQGLSPLSVARAIKGEPSGDQAVGDAASS